MITKIRINEAEAKNKKYFYYSFYVNGNLELGNNYKNKSLAEKRLMERLDYYKKYL